MVMGIGRRGLAALLAFATAGLAQYGEPDPDLQRTRLLRRMVAFLELPKRRAEAVRELHAAGGAAVPALITRLEDPRLDLFCRVLQILREIGPAAASAVPVLQRIAQGGDATRAYAARWCLMGIRPTGVTLVADSSGGRILEFDAKGEQVFELVVDGGLWDVELLPNGRFLVSQVKRGRVVEIDRTGKVLWKFECPSPIDADRLPNGHTLISCGRGGKVVEIDRAGKEVWSFASKWPGDVDRLATGNTLLTDCPADTVTEVDPQGRIVSRWTANSPIDVQRLPNGETLVVLGNQHRRIELRDPTGKLIRTFAPVKQPQTVQRLTNGHTLVGGDGELVEIDAAGKVVWRARGKVGDVHLAHRY
ncbi:MAG: PQQ-binding-like beta-propeller repeat protein [Planctomycetes bacterium]|nr:PQQ-binding-like beta-propeller repeat protein [Planctomycetota bacterium]